MATLDLYCEWGGDLIRTPNGSVQFATGWDQVREKIVRIVLTNSALLLPDGSTTAPDYVWDPLFGESGGALVDQNPTPQYIAGATQRITAAILASDLSATQPVVKITQPSASTFRVFVSVLINGVSFQTSITMGRGTSS